MTDVEKWEKHNLWEKPLYPFRVPQGKLDYYLAEDTDGLMDYLDEKAKEVIFKK